MTESLAGQDASPRLARRLTLSHAVLYGLGVTIGAGIYVLVGTMAGLAGVHAPVAFLIAAAVMAPTAASYAELAGRFPYSAGAAVYVSEGFGRPWLALVVGGLVAAAGLIATSAIAAGGAGYLRALVPMQPAVAITAVVLAMGAVAAWGIRESVTLAGVMTVIEIGGLVLLILAGLIADPWLLIGAKAVFPSPLDGAAWSGVLAASLPAVFAFIGFESLANIAEEVVEPKRTLTRAIFLTLLVSTVLYVLVGTLAVLTLPPAVLAASPAPLTLVFDRLTRLAPAIFTLIAIVATLNGIIVQVIMLSRVLYGLADRGHLPAALAEVHPLTRTPLRATAAVVACILALTLSFRIDALADMAAQVTLVIFALVNGALFRLKLRDGRAGDGTRFTTARWVPLAGALSCAALLVAALMGFA